MDDTDMFFNIQTKTDKQHILDNPDTYIGSVEIVDTNLWAFDNNKIVEKNIGFIFGLFKLFDEIIVNCRDHVVRMQQKVADNIANSVPVSLIDTTIADDGTITMINDGNGIDIAKHVETDKWMPELVFGHLRTSTNYNKNEKKIVGGKNGFGTKLVFIWSSHGEVETVDHIRGLKYFQTFDNNLDLIGQPVITSAKKLKPYTKIVFKPDYARLGLTGLSPEMVALFKKRVYDISAITDKTVKVKYNGDIVPVKNFEQYIDLYIGAKGDAPRVYEDSGDRWSYAVALTPKDEFMHVSFVNGICTTKGGTHVDYVLGQITRKLVKYIEDKKKVKVNANSIKEQIVLFLRCDIENPAFDSQTKDYMNTPSAKFGSKCEISDKFIEKIAKMGVMTAACAITDAKDIKAAAKARDGTKTKKITGIPKLEDANFAGTHRSNECILILCEGDSAKTAIISGLLPSDRDVIGVYPLKGKVMNVRGEHPSKLAKNQEITDIMKILGLEMGCVYNTQSDVDNKLRYSKVVIMTDQDLDGSHIKGLCINLFQYEWASLTHIPGFIGFMNTPILKAKKKHGNSVVRFYCEGEYNLWKSIETNRNDWDIKYYKGLGTSSKAEFREYFAEKKIVGFNYTGQQSDDSIDMVFNKHRADDRKNWLETLYDKNSYADTTKSLVSYEEFINKELIHFSKYNCDRSIPNLMDGLKVSLRKILFSAFKRSMTTEIKVAQFSGYVSEHSSYHHGEESLNKAIVGMAQNFVGSNNINLLYPSGQFGSRIGGGSDSSSPRYIFTCLEKITRKIFPAVDDNILKYLYDDGTSVEPQFYVPIIPMVLINGATGVGTGFSTDIMCYNPIDIIAYLKRRLTGGTITDECEFTPYYEGFKGQTIKLSDTKYMFKGTYEKCNTGDNNDADTIRVTELPVGFWTEDFKQLLCELSESAGNKMIPPIKDFNENHTDTTIDVVITFNKGMLEKYENAKGSNSEINGVEKLLKLCTTNTTTNMNLFDYDDKLKKYDTVKDIIDDYYDIRLEHYGYRKEYMIEQLELEILKISNCARYIGEILAGTIDLRGKKRDVIIGLLAEKDYDMIEGNGDYKYLIKMPMDSVTEENVENLNCRLLTKQTELNRIKTTTEEQMWMQELCDLEEAYAEYKTCRQLMLQDVAVKKSEKKTDATPGKKKKTDATPGRKKKTDATVKKI